MNWNGTALGYQLQDGLYAPSKPAKARHCGLRIA